METTMDLCAGVFIEQYVRCFLSFIQNGIFFWYLNDSVGAPEGFLVLCNCSVAFRGTPCFLLYHKCQHCFQMGCHQKLY